MTTYGQILENRTLLAITGADATEFLDGLVTCSVMDMKECQSSFGALLTPQGKILFDFFIVHTGDGFLVDIDQSIAAEFTKRLVFYRLRKKVEITECSAYDQVTALWGSAPAEKEGLLTPDSRLSAMGWRLYHPKSISVSHDTGNYRHHRLELGMPEGGSDFNYGDVFPHDVLMDQFGGVDFKKGCFVGQEVVSRMQHRGTARKRIVMIEAETDLPDVGSQIKVSERVVGTLGSTEVNLGLAMVRLDRLEGSAPAEVSIGGVKARVKVPEWVDFSIKGER